MSSKSRISLRKILLASVILFHCNTVSAQEVVLNPATMVGQVQVGSEIIKHGYVRVYNTQGVYTAHSNLTNTGTVSPEYQATVDVPAGVIETYKIDAAAYLEDGRDHLFWSKQPVEVTEFTTSTLDLVLSDPAYIQGSVTTTTNQPVYKFGITAVPELIPSINSSTYFVDDVSSSYQFVVQPAANITLKAYYQIVADGPRYDLPERKVSVAAGETISVDYHVEIPSGKVAGVFDLDGPVDVDRYDMSIIKSGVYDSVSVARSNFTGIANTTDYALSGLRDGAYTVYSAVAYLNDGDDRYYFPYAQYSPDRIPTITQGSTELVDVTGYQAFLNGKLNITGTTSLADAVSAYIDAHGVGASIGGRSRDQVDLLGGDFDLIVSEGQWSPRSGSLRLALDDSIEYLNWGLYQDAGAGQYVAGGDTVSQDLTLDLGSVVVTYRVADGGVLSRPYLSGNCRDYDESNQLLSGYSIYSYANNQLDVQQGRVRFDGLAGSCQVTAWATVNGTQTKFSDLDITVEAGATRVVDVEGPVFGTIQPSAGECVNTDAPTYTGVVTDDQGVASVSVNGVEAVLTSTNNPDDLFEVTFSATISLSGDSLTEVVIVATDVSGNTASDTRSVCYDAAPPQLDWVPANGTSLSSSHVTVSGTAIDDAGIKSVTVNGEPVTTTAVNPGGVSFSTELSVVDGENTIEVVATDINDLVTTETRIVTVTHNQVPVAVISAEQFVECTGKGTSVQFDGSLSSDPDGDSLTYLWSGPFGTVTGISPSVVLSVGTHAFSLTVDDGHGGSATVSTRITVQDTQAPTVNVGDDVVLEATSAAGAAYVPVVEAVDSCGEVTVTLAPALASYPVGVTEVLVTATDTAANSASDTLLITVQDLPSDDSDDSDTQSPGSGFVTGGGIFDSPAGANRRDVHQSGRARFGFNAKYHKHATVPMGQLEFQVGGINFHSSDYEYLLVTGARAEIKGRGTVNGDYGSEDNNGYSFLVTVIDGQQAGGGGVDRFRIEISDNDSGQLVYDNVFEDGATGTPAVEQLQMITRGNIVIHDKNNAAAAPQKPLNIGADGKERRVGKIKGMLESLAPHLCRLLPDGVCGASR